MMMCLDVGGSYVDLAIMTVGGDLIRRRKIPMPLDDWRAFVAILRDALAADRDVIDPTRPVAMALAGLVDEDSGIVTTANLRCLAGRTLAADLTRALGRAVVIGNDANCFAMAEAMAGAARGHRYVLGVVLGSGVGGGMLVGGELLTAGGVGGEWGHGQVIPLPSPTGGTVGDREQLPLLQCGCGKWGCLDTLGAARGMERLHLHLHGIQASSRQITDAWLAREEQATATIGRWLDLVSGVLSMILNTFPATCVPVGGGLANVAALIEALDAAVRAGMLRKVAKPLLVPAALGGDAGLIGAALAAGFPSAGLGARLPRADMMEQQP